ncbi:MAG TPA: peroxiredoxin family protein [Chthonomonadaceae bacterium]|nr:peroxiredoxin family protein [Chthonomonadaceae bacterium]
MKPLVPGATPAPTHGHSVLGEAFNEGPRQHAYLMKGMPNIVFPVTTAKTAAQRFFTQGVAQLHGFWYFEAERSFRQAAAIDPSCAMAYWGMAMANTNNAARAREFIRRAEEKRANAGSREQMWIDALAGYYKPDARGKERDQRYLDALQAIVKAYPADLEAKAFFCLESWEHANTVPIKDYAAVDAMYADILKQNPMHPLHHYRIHLWNSRDDAKALNSAALCGPSSPGIAHMWHMQGHTYSSLHRYADAAWSQEAAARVDHAQMNRNRIMPDEVFNYAHNNQWLVEDLDYIGRVHSAIDLAKNMVELPRHPAYNTIGGSRSAAEGRMRLLQTLQDYELWDDAIALSRTNYLEPTDLPDHQIERLRLLAVAACSKPDVALRDEVERALTAMKQSGKARISDGEKTLSEAERKSVDDILTEMRCYAAIGAGDRADAAALLTQLGDKLPRERAARLWMRVGNTDKAIELARSGINGRAGQVAPLGCYVDILFQAGKKDEARNQFKKLREISGSIDSEDMATVPLFRRLSVAADGLGLPIDWRLPPPMLKDIGPRPPLASLGPFRWHPVAASGWTLADKEGKRVSLADYTRRGRPVIMVLYLGSGCPACVEQLNALAPMAKEFDAAGISLVAIGVDPRKELHQTLEQCKTPEGFPFPVLSDKEMRVFKAYRAYDDFEKMPLHGVYLIDGRGLVRWQDIGFKPFTQTKFLLDEARRLLALPEVAQTGVAGEVAN